ncbi:2-oxoglutarate ferredoxin oxidoreductase subunit alpha [Dysgonomonas sp. PFB1-18]|uniref:2-oxoacid:acceptor oxidoreductase subunit alpha n=1 Tax=unclassified Dysgonomonas TaxID=2630389 RepID=UPI002473A102|nr:MULTISPECIES: 2-oxoacid:acceptor oxidoreductase subunit alpha [unclassified Dysgonomonas]MDH6309710.1 2-oxoglutarate ferredoxin oxidoreductase subunit alpha [Dysgonomonas sp. PF1-14]MDH6339282.1 2-oxoglutarate ferredoxin oxidoreductase subunit alpha [Dysgonomonas sp. PF1-16]MDH6380781.1 2-oxoglutarate ferredoxin oxidoreductase subunit alpha [Dysgonomonas sp. PFB1-18]MDH6398277.1 2-oxoglutarate ferredoxin oxidoreductase subunit alpha [Dysgonomonas sp. PF1-23]
MQNTVKIKDVKNIVIRFSGDSGDGMQLTGTIFSNLSAIFGNQISTFPDFPAEIRAPQGTLSGVSGFQVHLGNQIYNSGDKSDVLVAMNPAALKVNANYLKEDSVIVIDSDSFAKRDLEKALFATESPFAELGLTTQQIISVPITTLTKDSLEGMELDMKSRIRCKNMFALGLVCWLFNRPLDVANHMLSSKFAKKPILVEANLKVLADGFNYGHNTDMSIASYRVETVNVDKGFYIDVNGNTATAYGLIAASENAGRPLFLGSYPITPATDILQELVKFKQLGVKAIQVEDEIAGVCTAIGASFAGNLAATSTSGPGLALKSEAIGLAVMAELPLVVIDVQRGGPSTGLPTKTEQTDLRQALYGRNGESPIVVVAAASPTDCFDMAYWASKIALEHITPVILLTDGYIANGSSAWRIPDLDQYPPIKVHDQSLVDVNEWRSALRDDENYARYWAAAGLEGYTHRIGGLEKDYISGAISTDPVNHQKMVDTRQAKVNKVADFIPQLELIGGEDADLLIVGWGGTYGHLREAVEKMNAAGHKVALAHFRFISPLPNNAASILRKFAKVVVAEQNTGQFAGYLMEKIPGLQVDRYNKVEGQPFSVSDLIESFTKKLEE